MPRIIRALMAGMFLASAAASATGQEWKAGVASAKINPEGSIWMAGFRVRPVRPSEAFAVPGCWHMAAHRHHAAMTRGLRRPRSAG